MIGIDWLVTSNNHQSSITMKMTIRHHESPSINPLRTSSTILGFKKTQRRCGYSGGHSLLTSFIDSASFMQAISAWVLPEDPGFSSCEGKWQCLAQADTWGPYSLRRMDLIGFIVYLEQSTHVIMCFSFFQEGVFSSLRACWKNQDEDGTDGTQN